MHGEMHNCKEAILLLPRTPSVMLMFNSIRFMHCHNNVTTATPSQTNLTLVRKCCAISEFHGGEEFDCPAGLHGVTMRIVTVCLSIGTTARDDNRVNQIRLADGLR